MLPVLHLNGYKIANPTILVRIPHEELEALFKGYGYVQHFVEGDEPEAMHQKMAATLERCIADIRDIQTRERANPEDLTRPHWPMIVLHSPKGWTEPKEVDGHKVENFWRSHQVPIADPASNHRNLAVLEAWMRSYKPR